VPGSDNTVAFGARILARDDRLCVLLTGEVLVLGRAQIRHVFGGLVDAAGGLIALHVVRFELEAQRPVRQLAETVLEKRIDRAGEDDVAEARAIGNLV